MRAKDIMTPEPVCCTPRDTLERAAHLMEENDCGCLPVVEARERGTVIGVVTDRDIAVRGVGRGLGSRAAVQEVMTEGASCCGRDAELEEVEKLMSDRQIRRVVVVDDRGCCVGMVAQADLARAAEAGNGVTDEDVGRVVERISEPANEPWQPGTRG